MTYLQEIKRTEEKGAGSKREEETGIERGVTKEISCGNGKAW